MATSMIDSAPAPLLFTTGVMPGRGDGDGWGLRPAHFGPAPQRSGARAAARWFWRYLTEPRPGTPRASEFFAPYGRPRPWC